MHNEILIRFLLAALWGGLVGSEREYRGKAAGFRTTMMISIGACFFTIMSQVIGAGTSPDRIASNIVTGIGFLGAGVIFRGDNQVNGITTAATIWAVAAVGMGIGAGYYFASGFASLLILIVLALLPYIERYIDKLNQAKVYTLNCRNTDDALPKCEQLLKEFGLKYKLVKFVKDEDNIKLIWQVQGKATAQQQFAEAIAKQEFIKRLEY